jgi:hypothetical protein
MTPRFAVFMPAYGVDLTSTDEDKIDLKGRRSIRVIKPDWSPKAMLTFNYLCHLIEGRRFWIEPTRQPRHQNEKRPGSAGAFREYGHVQ